MYLVSIYFDEETNKTINRYIQQVAKQTGNTFMLDGKVPPHITISAFESLNEEMVLKVLEQSVETMESGQLQWVSIGTFLPHVIFLQPVLNRYLHQLQEQVYETIQAVGDSKISAMYQPFQWLAHTTIGKTLTREQMQAAFVVLQNSFVPFEGRVIKIGLAKTNPYTEIENWDL